MAIVTIDILGTGDEVESPQRKKPATEQRETRPPNRRLQKQVINIDGEVVPEP